MKDKYKLVWHCQNQAFSVIMGFTLAEVLVTLTIIGIIAAITIPGLIQTSQKREVVAQVLEYQSILSQAFKRYQLDSGSGDLAGGIFNSDSNWDNVNSLVVWNTLKPYFNLVKDCETNAGMKCFADATYKYLNGGTPIAGDSYLDYVTLMGKGILSGGASIGIIDNPYDCAYDRSISLSGNLAKVCATVLIDINGPKEPNKYGRDLFAWWIVNSGQVIPSGTQDDYLSGCDPASPDVTADASGAPGFGYGCTTKVIRENAVNY